MFQVLANLLEIVKDRAEAAEDELERVLTEFHERRASSVSSERSITGPQLGAVTGADSVSVGSDDVFEGSSPDRLQFTAFWEVSARKRAFYICFGVLRVFVLFCVFVFVRAILSWCP